MLIEQVLPKVIGEKATLHRRLAAEGKSYGLSDHEIQALISITPLKLLNSECFLDRLTDLWRYEFGLPFTSISQKQYVWGTHMWPPVKCLFAVVRCAHTRLVEQQRRRYLERLANPEKHMDTLAEFLPILRLPEEMVADFEVPTGVGNHDVEWRITSSKGRPVLIEVKSRLKGLLEMINQIEAGVYDPDGTAPAPKHDVSLLFRSIEQKYSQYDPTIQLQGAWIITYIKQEETELSAAFVVLDGLKVHFVILGDWEPGIKLLTRREEDSQFLTSLFREETSDRFHFSRGGTASVNVASAHS